MANELSLEQVTRALKGRMAKSALLHIHNVDVRTGTVLEVARLFRRTGASPQDAELTKIILDPSHPRRVTTAPGPTLFYKDTENEGRQFAIDMRTMILDSDSRLRDAARHYFMALTDKLTPCLSSRTRKRLDERAETLTLSQPDKWQPAALELHDAIEEDLLCQIAGLRQSIKEQYDEGLQYYIQRVLNPTLNGLEKLELPFMHPSVQGDQICKEIAVLAQGDLSLRAACEEYVRKLGTLPLTGSTSFIALVKSWGNQHEITENALQELFAWMKMSPLAQFYGCIYILLEPAHVLDEYRASFGNTLLEIMEVDGDSEEKTPTYWFWKLSHELAQHYMHHFATRAPGAMGEPLAVGTWWLAQRLAEVLCENIPVAKHLRDVALLPNARNSELVWRLSNPRLVESPASLASYWKPSLWKISVLSVVQQAEANVLRASLADTQRERLEVLITKELVLWYPTRMQDGLEPIYLFEARFQEMVEKWISAFGESQHSEFLRKIVHIYEELLVPEKFFEKFTEIASVDEVNQLILANAARILSLRNHLPLDQVWGKLTDSKWRHEAFKHLKPRAMELLFFAFTSSLQRGGDQWAAGLPHLYAHECEEISGDAEKMEGLFMFTVISCIHAYSVSALERLLTGNRRSEVLGFAQQWRAHLMSASRGDAPWVTGRLRAITAAISAAL